MPERVLVTGATGTVGRYLAGQLLTAGAEVRALCRDPGRAARLLPDGVETVPGDLTDPGSLRAALKGIDRAFVVLAQDAGAAFTEVGPDALPDHLVLLSAPAPDRPGDDNPLFRKHVLGEARVSAAGPPVTVLRPGPFASLALQWAPAVRGGGVVGAVHPDLALPVVDPRDIADTAAAVLLAPAPSPGPLPLSGPEALDTYDRVRILGEVLGRPLRVRRMTGEEWTKAVAGRLPRPYARALLGVEEYLSEVPPPVVPTVERITGHPPRPFRAWAEDNAAAFFEKGSRPD